MFSALFIIALVGVVAYLAVSRHPRRTENLFRWFWTFRSIGFAAFWLLLGFFSVASGSPPLVLFGAAIYLVAFLYYAFEKPQRSVKAWIQ